MKKIALLITLILLTNCNNIVMEEKYELEAFVSVPVGFPVRIYAGRVGDIGIMSNFRASLDKGWGHAGSAPSGQKHLPKDIDIVWLSYVEDCFYRVKGELDYPKLLKLFREGYKERAFNLEAFPTGYREENYRTFVVGLAPGGTVVVWIYGSGRQIEVARFQAEKIDIKQPEGLDSHDALIFSRKEREETLADERFRPPHIANKPTPFGLWDEYRDIKYPWYPTFELYSDAEMGDIDLWFHNRERWEVFYSDMVLEQPPRKDYSSDIITLIPDIFYQKGEDISEREYPLPSKVRFVYKANNGALYNGGYEFDWEETKAAFAEYFAKYPNTRARLNFRVNKMNTLFTVRLENENGEGVPIPFHKKRLYLRKFNNEIYPSPTIKQK